MSQRTKIAITLVIVTAAIAFFLFAPVVYSPTTVYGPLILSSYPTYPNWESASCAAFHLGFYYGRTVFQYNDSYQFGCPSPAAAIP